MTLVTFFDGGGASGAPSWAGQSHIGNVRQRNEDCYAGDAELGLWLVCDGIGGGADGDKASSLAVSVIMERYRSGSSLDQAIIAADAQLRALGSAPQSGKHRPGCTVAALALRGDSWQLAWVGDSRGWMLHESELRQISVDHTIVRQLVNWGDISEEEALTHPDRHKLSQALGLGDRPPKVAVANGICAGNP